MLWQRTVHGRVHFTSSMQRDTNCCLVCLVQQAGEIQGQLLCSPACALQGEAKAAKAACLTHQHGDVQIGLPTEDARYPASRRTGADSSVMYLPAEDQDIAGGRPHHGRVLPVCCGGLR